MLIFLMQYFTIVSQLVKIHYISIFQENIAALKFVVHCLNLRSMRFGLNFIKTPHKIYIIV